MPRTPTYHVDDHQHGIIVQDGQSSAALQCLLDSLEALLEIEFYRQVANELIFFESFLSNYKHDRWWEFRLATLQPALPWSTEQHHVEAARPISLSTPT